MERRYAVVPGWIHYYRVDDGMKSLFCAGNPWFYDTEEEAREQFDVVAAGLALDYRVERQCAGRAWRERSACVELQLWDEVAYGWGETVGVLAEASYGLEEWERDYPDGYR